MKKIMFNDKYGLTQAVLEGRKTMTRRVITIPEKWHGIEVYGVCHVKGQAALELTDGDDFCIEDPRTGRCAQILPTYKIGEEVAVAQSYKDIGLSFIQPPDPQWGCTEQMSGYENKMFVRADLMPHQIRITNIKVERLQDISEEDALKEGIYYNPNPPKWREYDHYEVWHPSIKPFKYTVVKDYCTAKFAFADLIDRVSGKGTWNSNPWVFAYTFELVK